MGLEPMTSSLPRKCSTTELQQRIDKSGEGNRTLTTSLEGWGSTIELHPRFGKLESADPANPVPVL